MSLKFQRLIIIFLSVTLLFAAVLLILYNSNKNIIFFYTPTEIIDNNLSQNTKIRIGGFVKKNSFNQLSLNSYEFYITDNNNYIKVYYNGILPDLFREGQGAVIEGVFDNKKNIKATNVYAKHDENYMPNSIKKELQKQKYWKKNYK